MTTQRFTATVARAPRGHVLVPVPFDPDATWGRKPRHLVGGTVNGVRVRGAIDPAVEPRGFTLGPAWLRGGHLAVGDSVSVEIAPEGPQRGDIADDIAIALEEHPQAGAFFDSLAQFYRRAYVRWIDGTKRRPEERRQRLAEMVRLLEAGHKERPRV